MNKNYNDCPPYLRDFLTYIRVVLNHTERTQDSYYQDIKTFLRYIKIRNGLVDPKTPFGDITISDVPISYMESFTLMGAYDYMNYLISDRSNSNSTRARRTTSLRKFFEYLATKALLIPKNPLEHLEHPKKPDVLPKYLNLEQALTLLKEIDSKNKERDFCIITLFLNCGMRLSELVGLNIADYSESMRTLRLFGKGQKERIVYLNDACIKALNDYLAVRPKSVTEKNAIFISNHGSKQTRLTQRRVEYIVEDQLKRAGLGNLGLSVHKLRHTAATIMYQYSGADTLVLKDILGHKSVATTQIYTHLSDKDRQSAVENSPLKNVKILTNDTSSETDENE